MIFRLLRILLSLLSLSLLSLLIFKNNKADIDLFNKIVVNKEAYTIKDLIKDSPKIFQKIIKTIKKIGFIKFILTFILCLILRFIFILFLIFWVIKTYLKFKKYKKNYDIGAFYILDQEINFAKHRSLLGIMYIYMPKCGSFLFIYLFEYFKKNKKKNFLSKFFNFFLIFFILGTSIWNLTIFIDILEELDKIKLNCKNERWDSKIEIYQIEIKKLILYRYNSSTEIISKIKMYKSDDGIEFNPKKIMQKQNDGQELYKIRSKQNKNYLDHPIIANKTLDQNEFVNGYQLTKKPIKNTLFFELKNIKKKNFILLNIIQNEINIFNYNSERKKEILIDNGINTPKKLEIIKTVGIIKQNCEKNIDRIYELPDGRKITVKAQNQESFIEGFISDFENKNIEDYDKTTSLKLFKYYEKVYSDFQKINNNDLLQIKKISELELLNLHIDSDFNEIIEWAQNKWKI